MTEEHFLRETLEELQDFAICYITGASLLNGLESVEMV